MAFPDKHVYETPDLVLDFSDKIPEGVRIDEILDLNIYEGNKSIVQQFDLTNATLITLHIQAVGQKSITVELNGARQGALWIDTGDLIPVEGMLVEGSEGVDSSVERKSRGVAFRVQGGIPGRSYTVRGRVLDENGKRWELSDTLLVID